MKAMMRSLKGAMLAAGLFFVLTGSAQAVGTLITVSSATFYAPGNNVETRAMTIDSAGNIIVVGRHNAENDAFILKYAPNFVLISSTSYHLTSSDAFYAVATDTSNNIIAAGCVYTTDFKLAVVKFTPDLVMIASTVYYQCSFSAAKAAAVDHAGNIIVAGKAYIEGIPSFITMKYSSNLVLLSTATYTGGVGGDTAYGMAVDASDNIIVTGPTWNALNEDFYTIKYSSSFAVLSSARYDSGYRDISSGVAVDGSGNIVVTGVANSKFFTIKYGPNLTAISTASYAYASGGVTGANDVAVDGYGNYIVAGLSQDTYDYCTIKYDQNLVTLSSARYDGGSQDTAYSVAVDSMSNIITGGWTTVGGRYAPFIIKYNGLLPVLSSISPVSGYFAEGTTVTVRGERFFSGATVSIGGVNASSVTYVNATTITALVPASLVLGAKDVVVTNLDGACSTLSGAFSHKNPVVVSAVFPSSGTVAGGTAITVVGAYFENGDSVSIGGIAATNVAYVGPQSLTAVTPANATAGSKDVVVTHSDGMSGTLAGGFTYSSSTAVITSTATTTTTTTSTSTSTSTTTTPTPSNSNSTVIDLGFGGSVTIAPVTGNIMIGIPSYAFDNSVTITLSTAAEPSCYSAAVKHTGICFEITNSLGLQPAKFIEITANYRDADIVGLDESKLTLARYENGAWIPIPTVVYANQNKLVGIVQHLSTFAIVQIVPAADLANVKAYPIPYNPSRGSLSIENLTREAAITIFTITGELVRTVGYVSANGSASWDGRNDNGATVASGVYILYIKSDAGTKKLKIAVVK